MGLGFFGHNRHLVGFRLRLRLGLRAWVRVRAMVRTS